MAGVKRVIRNCLTGELLAENGNWTREYSKALVFPDLGAAMSFRDGLGLSDVELLLIIGEKPDPARDIVFPLKNASSPPPGVFPAQKKPDGPDHEKGGGSGGRA